MSFSMMGSGIYSTTVTHEIVCEERCEECTKCDNVWDEDFETDDRGRVEQDVTCSKCGHKYEVQFEDEEI